MEFKLPKKGNKMIHNEEFTFLLNGHDHVICDPPYSAHVHNNAATMRGGKAGKNELGFDSLSSELRMDIARAVADAKSWSVIFCDWEGLSAWKEAIEDAGGEYIRAIPWVRWSMPQLSGDRPPQGSECIILAHPGGKKVKWTGPGNLICFNDKAMRGKDKHKCQKPLGLMLKLVDFFTEPGSTVIDPCAGSGTTLMAAKILGRKFEGWEIQAEWAAKIEARLLTVGERDAKAVAEHEVYMQGLAEDKARMKANTTKIREKRK